MNEVQETLASQFGLIYKSLYYVEYKDRNYPCQLCRDIRETGIIDCDCHDGSYKKVLMYDGVYSEPERTISLPSRGNYFLFTNPDPVVQEFRGEYFALKNKPSHTMAEMESLHRDGVKIRNWERYVWFSQISDYTITLHRRSWDKLPKNRHEPVDLPIDFSKVCN